jgi:hypothetical protein
MENSEVQNLRSVQKLKKYKLLALYPNKPEVSRKCI